MEVRRCRRTERPSGSCRRCRPGARSRCPGRRSWCPVRHASVPPRCGQRSRRAYGPRSRGQDGSRPEPRNTEGHLGDTPGGLCERLRTMETIRGTARGRPPPGLRSHRADEGRRTCGCWPDRDQQSRRRSTERPSARWRSGSAGRRRFRHWQVDATRDANVPGTRDTPRRCAGAPRTSSSCLAGRESRGTNTPGTSGRASMVERVAVRGRSGRERASTYSSGSRGAQASKSKKSRSGGRDGG